MVSDRDQLAGILRDNEDWYPDNLEAAADAILVAGWRPPARVIETVEELDALPVGAIVAVSDGRVWLRESGDGQCWFEPGWSGGYTAAEAMGRVNDVGATVTVLREPEEGQ